MAGLANADFYFSPTYPDGPYFWANNTGMVGLVDLGVVPGSLSKIPLPTTGWSVAKRAVVGHVYVSPANSNVEPGHYIVFRVISIEADTGATLLWIYI
jgi:hypothetical protein